MSKLLISDYPLMVLPKLAVKIGLNEAIALQQVHFWLESYKSANDQIHFKDGRWWVYNSRTEWVSNFPFWSDSTVWRTLLKLRDIGILIVNDKYNRSSFDKTLWYTIDYDKLNELELDDNFDNRQCQNDIIGNVDLTSTIPETTTETNNIVNSSSNSAQENSENSAIQDQDLEAVRDVSRAYEQEIGMLTPYIREDIEDAIARYPRDWIIEAIREAAKNNVRTWSYISAILGRWQKNGFKVDTRMKSQNMGAPRYKRQGGATPEVQAIIDEARKKGEWV